MGNSSPRTGHRVLSHGDYPCSMILNENAALNFGGRTVHQQGNNGEITEMWPLSLRVGWSSCYIAVTRTIGIKLDGSDDKLEVIVCDNTCRGGSDNIVVTIGRAEAGLLHPSFIANYNNLIKFINNSTITNAIGGVTETTFQLGDRESKGGLFVREEKKRRKDEKPYMVNLRYYFAVRPGEFSNAEFGFSVAVKRIRVSRNGRLEFDLEGPEQHPCDDLFYMFGKVIRTQTWKHTYCPHCCDEYIQSQRVLLQTSESESEDSDIGLHGRRPNGGRTLFDNGGKFWGHNNGNLNVRKFVLVKRK